MPFEVELTPEADEVTARAGLPMVQETMQALHLPKAIREHLSIRKRASGYDEVEHIEALVLLLAAGGDCLEDLALMGLDQGLIRLLDRQGLPSPDAARHKREATPHYDGGRGYQPVIAYWVERAFATLPPKIEKRRFRADSAFYEEHVLRWLVDPAHRIERFTISADLGKDLRAGPRRGGPVPRRQRAGRQATARRRRALCERVPSSDWNP